MTTRSKVFTMMVTITLKENPTEAWNMPEFSAGGPANRRSVMGYVRDAVKSWGGQFPPDHPMFPTNIKVRVKEVDWDRELDRLDVTNPRRA